VVISYLLGSVPFGWIAVKTWAGKDLRKIGSGTTGGTNVSRHVGPAVALLVGVCDVLKAFLPTRLAVRRYPNNHLLHLLVAAAAMLGNSRSIFLGFKGGKAVSGAAGALFALAGRERRLWDVFKLAMGVFFGAIIGSGGKVSLGSISGSTAGGVYALELAHQRKISTLYAFGTVGASAYIIYLHRENAGRIVRGEEPNTGKEILERVVKPVVRMLGRGQR